MSKRSKDKFARIDKEFYPTPYEAAAPVFPYLLREGKTFAEPCAGAFDLVRHITRSEHHRCLYSGDLQTGQDVLNWTCPPEIDFICTNPPWDKTRKKMHSIIKHLVAQGKPVWLLLPADWAFTERAVPYMAYCTDIVAVGRVRWIPGTKDKSFDNAAWFRFHSVAAGCLFHAREVVKRRKPNKDPLCASSGLSSSLATRSSPSPSSF